jgi:hypothetical protein
VPGDVKRAVLDAIAWARDSDVEHARQDLSAIPQDQSQTGSVIMLTGGGQRMLSLPPISLAVAWRYRDTSIG